MKPTVSKIIHPMGAIIETPLFVSSFSSKGFRFKENRRKEVISEIGDLIKSTSEFITESALVSAFDLKYYLGPANKLQSKFQISPSLLFIDSGGYETLDDYDLSEVYKHPIKRQDWSLQLYEEQLQLLPKTIPSVLVSYDNAGDPRRPLEKQIQKANKLFAKYPNQLTDFLIKPSTRDKNINMDEVVENVSLLKRFSVIGVTEKELGNSIFDRMRNLMRLRAELNKVDCHSPIHVFGNLDPLTSTLYFLNGAEIFDGLTWLRYAYYKGMTVYKANCDVLHDRIHQNESLNDKMTITNNLIYLENLRQQMKSSVKHFNAGDFSRAFKCFQDNGENLERIITSFSTFAS